MNASKTSLIALAATALSGTAFAQSSVTLFGLLDTGVSHYSVSGGQSKTVLSNHGNQLSRLGIRGTEDLGNGLRASFWLEAPLTVDDGTAAGLNFSRRSTISLSGAWGELRAGRDFTPTYLNDGGFDPFNATGVGTQVIVQARASNSAPGRAALISGQGLNNALYLRSSNNITYHLPDLGGIYGQAQYAFHEQANGGSKQGQYLGMRLGYKSQQLNVAVSAGKAYGTSSVAAPDISTYSLGASYNFKLATVMAHFGHDSIDSGAASHRLNGFMLGTSVPVGKGQLKLAYSQAKVNWEGSPKTRKLALGYVHDLSKRTQLYATVAHMKNGGGALLTVAPSMPGKANANSSGVDFGLVHRF